MLWPYTRKLPQQECEPWWEWKEAVMETHWMEIPAHRILAVDSTEFSLHYEQLDSNGSPCDPADAPTMIVRKRDGRRFKRARYCPTDDEPINRYARSPVYLEEM